VNAAGGGRDANEDSVDWRGSVLIPVCVFLAFACLFVLLRSNDIYAVDGSFRCLEVYRRPAPFLQGNNHLLYPVNVQAWTRLAAALGIKPDGPIEFFRLVEVMNSLAGAGALGILSFLMYRASSSWGWAIAGTAGYGFSKSFLESATNANEPMVGLFWSFLAVLAASASFPMKSNWPAVTSGLLFSLAMASYQTMILLAPVAIVLFWRSEGAGDGTRVARRTSRISAFALSGVAGSAMLFGWAYRRSGTEVPAAMWQRFWAHEDARAYLGVSIKGLLTVPIGLVRNIFPVLARYAPAREVLAEHKLAGVILVLVLLAFSAFLAYCVAQVIRNWSRLSPGRKTVFGCAAAGLSFSAVPLLIWSSNYDKFWLQPLGCLAFFLVTALGGIARNPRSSFLASRAAPAFLLAGVLSNLIWVVPAHTRRAVEFEGPERLAGLIGKDDLIVGGWESVSVIYGAVWSRDGQMISFPYDAVRYGKEAMPRLREAISKTREKSGRVYFLSVLDMTEPAWNLFLGPKCGIPYSALNFYRAHSRVAARFEGHDGPVLLRQLDSAESE